jgi:hypothetical protein
MGEMQMVGQPLTGDHILVPADDHQRAVFQLAQALLIAGNGVTGEEGANGIIVPGLARIISTQESSAVAACRAAVPLGEAGDGRCSAAILQHGQRCGSFHTVAPGTANGGSGRPGTALILRNGEIDLIAPTHSFPASSWCIFSNF